MRTYTEYSQMRCLAKQLTQNRQANLLIQMPKNETKIKDAVGQKMTTLMCCMHFPLQNYFEEMQGLQEKHLKYGEDIWAENEYNREQSWKCPQIYLTNW